MFLGLYAPGAAQVRVCGGFCDNLLAACSNVASTSGPLHGQLYASGAEMCTGDIYLGVGYVITVADTDCFAPCPGHCTGHGICIEGTCSCDLGYEGADCSDLSCPNDCSGQGECDHSRGRCECQAGFTLEDCSGLVCPGYMTIGEYQEVLSMGFNPLADDSGVQFVHCSGNGACNFTDAVCRCDPYYSGFGCERFLCPNNCSDTATAGVVDVYSNFGSVDHSRGFCNNGSVIVEPNTTIIDAPCACYEDYTLDSCAGLACPNNCSSHGICNYTTGACACDVTEDTTFIGADCSLRQCHHPGMLFGECPENSNCNFTAGICDCFSTHMGAMCEKVRCPGAGDCNLHGLCNYTGGDCMCFQGFQGSECHEYLCVAEPTEPPEAASSALAVYTPPLDTCNAAQITGLACCSAAQDTAAAFLIAALANVGSCWDAWSRLVCSFHCAPNQGQWAVWELSARSLPTLALVPCVNTTTPSPAPVLIPYSTDEPCLYSTDFCCTRNNTCCFGVQAAVNAIRTPFCAKTLLHFLYETQCTDIPVNSDGAAELTLCSNFSSDLHSSCADEPTFGYSVRRTFLTAGEFMDSLLPDNTTIQILVADGLSCLLGPEKNVTAPPPPDCLNTPSTWVSTSGANCDDYEIMQLCTDVGDYGVGWVSGWGTFIDWASDGVDATQACCFCGGGTDIEEPAVNLTIATAPQENSTIDWYELVAPDGYQYEMTLQHALSDTLTITICPTFCEILSSCGVSSCTDSAVNWIQLNVSSFDCFGTCPNDCNSRGSCYNWYNRSYEPNCQCEYPYTGYDCSLTLCPMDCSARGSCNLENGVCTCDHGFSGRGCEIEVCPGGCSEGGACDYATGNCACDSDRAGLDCADRLCMNACSGAGLCDYSNGQCSCLGGRYGQDCSGRNAELGALSPAMGPLRGGTAVTVIGQHFSSTSNITCRFWDDDRVTQAVYLNATAVVCDAPPFEMARGVSLHVIQGGHLSVNALVFRYYVDPPLREIVPYYGPEPGNSMVRIHGEGFFQAARTSCRFTFQESSGPVHYIIPATVEDSGTIACVNPPGKGTAVVSLTSNGQQYSIEQLEFMYFPENVVITVASANFTVSVTSSYADSLLNTTGAARAVFEELFRNETALLFGLRPGVISVGSIRVASRRLLADASATRRLQATVTLHVEYFVSCGDNCETAALLISNAAGSPTNSTLADAVAKVLADTALSFDFADTNATALAPAFVPAAVAEEIDESAGTPRYTVATQSVPSGRGISFANAGVEETIVISARDQFGEPRNGGNDLFRVVVRDDDGAAVVRDSSTHLFDLNYTVGFVVSISGVVRLDVTMLGHHIYGSPFSILVLSGPAFAPKSLLEGSSLQWDITNPGETAFEPFTGLVHVRDQFGNVATLNDASLLTFELMAADALVGTPTARLMSLSSMRHVPIVFDPSHPANSTYNFSFQPQLVGDHILSVRIDGDRLDGSPFGFSMRRSRPVPVQQANFVGRGEEIDVVFARETNQAGAQSAPSLETCQAVFTETSVSNFGHQCACFWRNSVTIAVVLGAGTPLELNSVVSIRAENVVAILENSLPTPDSFEVGKPIDESTIQVPVAVLDVPTRVGVCTDFHLDAGASHIDDPLDRPLRYEWALLYGRDRSNQLKYKLGLSSWNRGFSFGDSSIDVRRYDLSSENYYGFALVVTSFLNVSSIPSEGRLYKSRDDVPLVQIEGPAVVHTQRPDTLELHSSVEPSSCFPAVDAAFLWRQTDSHASVALGRTDTSALVVPAGTLQAGLTYQLSIIGYMLQNPNLINNDTVSIVVDYIGLQVSVRGGDRSISRADDCTLDARSSVDLDGTPVPPAMVFEWTCVRTTGETCEASILGYMRTASARLGFVNIPSGILDVGVYMFTVLGSKGVREDQATVAITVVAGDGTPYVTIDASVTSNGQVSASEKVVLRGSASTSIPVDGGLVYSWESRQIDLSAPGFSLSTTSLPNLIIAPFQLTPGEPYLFRLVVTPAQGGDSGFAEIRVLVNVPPCCGSFAAFPEQGESLRDDFTLATASWWDIPEDMPLAYRFYYVDPHHESALVPLTVSSSSPTAVVQLPEGNVGLEAQVADIYDAASSASFAVTVDAPDVAGVAGEMEGFLLDVVQRQAADAIAGGHSLLVLQLANAVAEQMNRGMTVSTGRRQLGAAESLRMNMLQHVLAVSSTTVMTPEVAQMQAHATSKLSAVPSELETDSRAVIIDIVERVAHTATSVGIGAARSSGAAMHRAINDCLQSSALEAEFDGLPDGTPSAVMWNAAKSALDQVAIGLLQTISCGEAPVELTSSLMRTFVARECNVFGGVMAGRDYSLAGPDSQTVAVTTPLFISPPSMDNSVGVAVTYYHVNNAVLTSSLLVGSPIVQAAAYTDGALGSAPGLQAGECFEMSLPTQTNLAPDKFPVCAEWEPTEQIWSRPGCNTLGITTGVVQNSTRCCCSGLSYFAVLLLPACLDYDAPEPSCLAIPPPPMSCPANCTGNGFCNGRNGTCTCNQGHFGSNCSNAEEVTGPQCHSECSGRGVCLGVPLSVAIDGYSGLCVCDAGYHGAGCQSEVKTDDGSGGMLDSEFPWVAVLIPSMLVVLTVFVVGYWLHWQRKRLSIVGMLYDAGDATTKPDEDSDDDEDAAWDWVAKSAGMGSKRPELDDRKVTPLGATDKALQLGDKNGGTKPLAIGPGASAGSQRSGHGSSNGASAPAPRMPPLLPRDIGPRDIGSKAASKRGSFQRSGP